MEPISSEKWKAIEALLDQALDMPAGERTRFLENASKDDPSLRKVLMELWDAGQEADAFLEGEVPADLVQVFHEMSDTTDYGPAPSRGMRFGDYEVEEEIGRGGMSVVYRARRVDGQFDHTVALKILKRGMDTEQLVRRFMSERQILAGLQHANIARLLDGGATDDGRPYLIMEYVKGVPITEYCDTQRLNIHSRLDLFRKVGEAVDFAHRNLIVHRDLKPSNILVTDNGEVKLLDFGIAKVLSADVDDTVLALTVTGGRIMTPEYAAPEQIYGEQVTTATDVYAMGVLLYELLCGHLPLRYEARRLSAMERTMRAHEVSLPSASLRNKSRTDHVTVEQIAEARNTTTLLLTQKIEGDLDMIVQKALRKEPERRYSFVSELLDEVERFQQGRPIMARPDSFSYRARKFYGRYKVGVLSAGLAVFLLIASLIGTVWQARVARQQTVIASEERDIARREAAKSARVTEFLVDVFESTDPDNSLGDTLTAYDILRRGAEQLEQELAEEPEVQRELMSVIGRMYQRMGDYDAAEGWFVRALDELSTVDGTGTGRLTASYNLASLMQDQGRYQQAESLLTSALERPLDLAEPSAALLHARAEVLLGNILVSNGAYDSARVTYEQAVAYLQEALGEMHPDVAPAYVYLGEVLGLLSEFEPAESYFEKAVAIYRTHPEGTQDDLAEVLHDFAEVLRNQGKFERAENITRESLEIRERLFGREHPLVVESMNQLGNILSERGENAGAEQIYLDALQIQAEALGEKHPNTIELLGNLGGNYIRMGDSEAAVVYLRRALALREEVLGSDHPTVAIALANLGVALGSTGSYAEAEVIHRRCYEMVKQHMGDNHPGIATCANNLADVLSKLGRFEDALPFIDIAIEIDRQTLDAGHPFVAIGISNKGQILFELGQAEAARELLEQALDIFAQSDLPPDHHMPARTKIALGKLHLSENRLAEARPLLESALALRQKAFEQGDWRIGEAEAALGMYHLQAGNTTQGRALLEAGRARLIDGLGANHRLAVEASRALSGL